MNRKITLEGYYEDNDIINMLIIMTEDCKKYLDYWVKELSIIEEKGPTPTGKLFNRYTGTLILEKKDFTLD